MPEAANIPDDIGLENPNAGAQLSRLSAILNGLDAGAQVMRRQAQQVMVSVKEGTYQVDPALLSRRIIGDILGRA